MAQTWTGKVKAVAPGPHIPMPVVRDPRSIRIVLARGECFGTCSVYRVEITGTGEVLYSGRRYVLIENEHRTQIAPHEVQALLDQFRKSDFWSLRSKYVAPVTDNASYELTVSFDGRTKSVTDYVGRAVGMPEVVTRLENAVDLVAGTAKWVYGNAETITALKQEKWQFATEEGARVLARASLDAPDALAFGLIEAGAPVKRSVTGNPEASKPAASALDNAALKARLDLARRLIAMGAAELSGAKDSALRAAVASGHPAVVAEILKLNPNVNLPGQDGLTPMMWIEAGPRPFNERPELTDTAGVIALLISAGADPNIGFKDKSDLNGWSGGETEGNTVLHMTVDADNAREYVRWGAKVDQRNSKGETPAMATFSEDVALVLLDHGADPKAQSRDGASLQTWAKAQGWKAVIARLRSNR
jgi:hypothetical protein